MGWDRFDNLRNMANNKIKTISFIVPALNEEKTLEKVLNGLIGLKLGIEKEIIVVNDGSTDRTLKIAQKYKSKNFKIISHKTPMGKGFSVRDGIKAAKGDIITIQDADLEYNVNDFKKLIKPLIEGKAKVVYGSRFLKKNKKGHNSFYFRNRILSFLTTLLYFGKITDMETCYKVFDKGVIKGISLESDGFEIEPEITSKLLKKGVKIIEIPIDYNPRPKKEGKRIRFSDGFRAVWTLLRFRV